MRNVVSSDHEHRRIASDMNRRNDKHKHLLSENEKQGRYKESSKISTLFSYVFWGVVVVGIIYAIFFW